MNSLPKITKQFYDLVCNIIDDNEETIGFVVPKIYYIELTNKAIDLLLEAFQDSKPAIYLDDSIIMSMVD